MQYSKEAETRYKHRYQWIENPLDSMHNNVIENLFQWDANFMHQPQVFSHYNPFLLPHNGWTENPDFAHQVGATSAFIHFETYREHLPPEKQAEYIANICKGMKSRPLTLLVHGSSRTHSVSHIARITADNKCELLVVNSLPGDDEYEQHYLGIIKNGVNQALNLQDQDFVELNRVAKQQKDFSCVAIAAAVLTHVDPNQTLAQQRHQLEDVLSAAIEHSATLRRLIARIQWWHNTIGYRRENVAERGMNWVTLSKATAEQKNTMKTVFAQLFDHVLGIQPKTKFEIPTDHIEMCAKFLHLFDIKVNDAKFLALFDPIEANIAANLLMQYPQQNSTSNNTQPAKHADYFKYKHWKTHRDAVLTKLGTRDKHVKHALDSLARHSRAHLASPLHSKRAQAGHKKYQQLQQLLDSASNLNELQQNLKVILDTPAIQSELLNNRGGFFGAYKKFSQIAANTGRKHFKYNDQYAVSSTHQRLIALYDAVSSNAPSR